MFSDLQAIADPRLLLLSWAGGLGLSGSFVVSTRVGGRGFTWLAAGTAGLVGIGGVLSLGPLAGWIGMAGLAVAIVFKDQRVAAAALGFAGLGLLVAAVAEGGGIPAVTAAIALGGVMGEMLLGHWYLVDPRLPRWALRTLAAGGIAGLVAEAAVWGLSGELPAGGGSVAFWVLIVTSIVLMVAVVASLRYPAYSGVMAATGLSYLCVLTSLGAAFLGRALAGGIGPFAS